MDNKKIYIVLLNYNNWQDTIECLESVLRNEYPDYQVIVVDNNSPDNSMEYIKNWLDGKIDVWLHPENPLKNLSFPPLKKPIPYIEYTKEQAVKGGFIEKEKTLQKNIPEGVTTKYPVVLIQAGENRGFSAGNNIGIKYALSKGDFEYIWLLNNDTVIKKDTLVNLINCAEKLGDRYSPIGTLLLYYEEPDRIQALGGKFNKYFSTSKHIFANLKLKDIDKFPEFDYIVGASILLRKKFIKDIGLLSEEYFIYYEEIDLAFRARQKGYKMFICKESIVYHKESVTIKNQERKSNNFSDYYRVKNRIKLTKKFYPQYLPLVYAGIVFSIIKRIKRKKYKQALNVFKILIGRK